MSNAQNTLADILSALAFNKTRAARRGKFSHRAAQRAHVAAATACRKAGDDLRARQHDAYAADHAKIA